MSASDLVPRVVLFISDMEGENDELKAQLKAKESQLKEQENERLLVQITGPNRTPIYYEGSMKNGYSNGDEWRLLVFDPNNVAVRLHLTLSLFTDLEIWLGGVFIEHFQDVDRLNGYYFTPDDSESGRGMGFFDFLPGSVTRRGRRPVGVIHGSIGPMTSADYNKLTDEQLDLEEQITSHNNISFTIESINFRKDKIRGIMSLLEKFGIPTSDGVDEDEEDDDDDNDDDSVGDSDEETSDDDEEGDDDEN